MDEVHYYCSPETFLSLVKNSELWLTSLLQSNDHSEGIWIFDKMYFAALTGGGFHDHGFHSRLKVAAANFLQRYKPLGICFSDERDVLSQWRAYATDGAGFSVSFWLDGIEKIAETEIFERKLQFNKVEYFGDDLRALAGRVDMICDAFRPYLEIDNGNPYGFEIFIQGLSDQQMDEIMRALSLACSIKNPAFAEELESRLFLVANPRTLSAAEFRSSGGVLSPFLRIEFPKYIVNRVTLGPNNPNTKEDIQDLLTSYGFDCLVEKSEASYRSGR